MKGLDSKETPHGIGNSVPDGFYTTRKTGELIGRSYDTLLRWRKTGVFSPSSFMTIGKLKIWLYSVEDIEHLKELATTIRPGRPSNAEKESEDESGI